MLSLAAYLGPAWLPERLDPFLATSGILWHLIAVTMFAIGWMLPRDEVLQVARRWPLVLAGTAIQFATMPLAAWLVARGVGLQGDALTGAIIVGCVPGAMASNVLTLMARGNVSYSLSLTTSATLLSPLVVPLALQLTLGKTVDVPVATIMLRLVWAIVVPVVAGHVLGRSLPKWESTARRVGSTIANLAILWIIAVVVAVNRDKLNGLASNWNASLVLVGSLALINVVGYLAGYGGGWALRLPEPMRRALTLEIGMQNAGLGATLAKTFFSDEAAIPAALFTFGCMFTGTILARLWANMEPSPAPSRERSTVDSH